jgi:hypothetical protein
MRTFSCTTQYAKRTHDTTGIHLFKNLKAQNPALNVRRQHEPVATDTVYSNTKAIARGACQSYVRQIRVSLSFSQSVFILLFLLQ